VKIVRSKFESKANNIHRRKVNQMQYELSNEVEKVANAVIKEHLTDLASKRIVYITQEKKDDKTGVAVAQMRKGKPIIGDVKLVGGLNAFLASGEARTDHNGPTPFAVLVVSRYAWDELKPEQRKAWTHQQLNRLDYNVDTGKPSILDYDIKEFSVIAKLYGAWNDDLSLFLKTAKQHPLFEDLDSEVAADKGTPKIVKAGDFAGNGKAETVTEVAASVVPSLKEQVAKKRGRAATARK
jgi:hypothetical protein